MSIDVTPGVRQPAPTLTVRVAAQIRAVMAYKQIRQSQLARRIGKGEQWLSVRLRGVQPIDLNDLEMIAAVLEVEPDDLVRPGAAIATLRYPPNVGVTPELPTAQVPPSGRPRVNRPPGRQDGRAPGPGRTYRTRPPIAAR